MSSTNNETKQVFTIEMIEVKPAFKGTITDSVSGNSLEFHSAGMKIDFISKHLVQ